MSRPRLIMASPEPAMRINGRPGGVPRQWPATCALLAHAVYSMFT